MKKHIILIPLLLCVMCSVTALAANVTNDAFNSENISVFSGKAAPDSLVSAAIFASGKTRSDAQNGDADALIYFNQMHADKNGYFAFVVDMSGRSTDYYNMRVTSGGQLTADFSFPFSSTADAGILNDFNTALQNRSGLQFINTGTNKLKLELSSSYDGVEDVNLANVMSIIESKAPYSDKTTCVDVYRQAMIAEAFSKGVISSTVEIEDCFSPFRAEPFKSIYGKKYITEAVKTDIAARMKGKSYTSNNSSSALEQFYNALKDAIILAVTKSPSGPGDISETIKAFYPRISGSILTEKACRRVMKKDYAAFGDLKADLEKSSVSQDGDGRQNNGVSGGGTPFKADGKSDAASDDKTPITSTVRPSGYFDDLGGYEWAEKEINSLAERKIVSGRENRRFVPEDNITRAEFTAIAVNLLGLSAPDNADIVFEDVHPEDWYYSKVMAAYNFGIVDGISNDRFGADSPITRQDAMVIVARCIGQTDSIDDVIFADESQISDYAAKSVKKLAAMRIVSGYNDNTVRPLGNINRAEAAKILYNAGGYMSAKSDTDSSADGAQARVSESAQRAYGVLQYAGIMPEGEFALAAGDFVSREEFAEYLARMFGANSARSEITINDVDKTTERGKAVYAAVSNGTMSVDSDFNFRPKDMISYNDMVKAGMKALGYDMDNYWDDYMYVSRAGRLRLLDGVSGSDRISETSCVVFLFNLLHADTVTNIDNGRSVELQKGRTVLDAYFNMGYVKGIVTSNAYAQTDGQRTSSVDYIGIDGKIYRTKNPNIAGELGYKVIAYFENPDHSGDIVYFVRDTANKTITIDSDSLSDNCFDGSSIKYEDSDGRQRTIRLKSNAAVIRNSNLVTTDYSSAFNIDSGRITCVSYGDSEYDVVIIEATENYKINSVDVSQRIIYTDSTDGDGKRISIDFDNKQYVRFTMLPYGQNVNEINLESGDMISVCASEDGQVIIGYLLGETVTGKVESVYDKGIRINGIKYEFDKNFGYDSRSLLGAEGEFTLDIRGRICDFKRMDNMAKSIGYLYAIAEGRGLDEKIRLKIYTLDRKHLETTLADKVKFDGSSKSDAEAMAALCTASGGRLKGQLVMFETNGSGQITVLTTVRDSKESCEHENMLYKVNPDGAYKWTYNMKVFDSKYAVSNNTYYIKVPKNDADIFDESFYGCQPFKNITWWNRDATHSEVLGLYKFRDDTPYVDIILVESSGSATIQNTTEVTVVSSVSTEVDSEGKNVYAVHGYQRGNEVTAYIPKELYEQNGTELDIGDIFRFETDNKGYATAYRLVYDWSEDDVQWDEEGEDEYVASNGADSYSNRPTNHAAGVRYTFGYVNKLYLAPYSSGENSLLQIGSEPDSVRDSYQVNSNETANTRYIIVDKNRRKDKVYMSDFYEASSYENTLDISSTSRAFVHTRSGWLIAVIIYK